MKIGNSSINDFHIEAFTIEEDLGNRSGVIRSITIYTNSGNVIKETLSSPEEVQELRSKLVHCILMNEKYEKDWYRRFNLITNYNKEGETNNG